MHVSSPTRPRWPSLCIPSLLPPSEGGSSTAQLCLLEDLSHLPSFPCSFFPLRSSVFCKDMRPGRALDPAALGLLLEAASWAPSHGRTDPWHFVVFQSQQGELLWLPSPHIVCWIKMR